MWNGTGSLEGIYVAPKASAPTQSVSEIAAKPGQGLYGDRYAIKLGTFSKPKPDYELTLIEAEALEAMKTDYKIDVAPHETRRNLLTRGVPLNHLVGCEFQIGEVKIRGIRLCEPCSLLQKTTGRDVMRGLRHRGGLRAQVLSAGTLRIGDLIKI